MKKNICKIITFLLSGVLSSFLHAIDDPLIVNVEPDPPYRIYLDTSSIGYEETTTDLCYIFFRVWSNDSTGQLSSTAVPIRLSPHYKFARLALIMLRNKRNLDLINKSPEQKAYQAYAAQEKRNMEGVKNWESLSSDRYLEMIRGFYKRGYNIHEYPFKPTQFGISEDGNAVYYSWNDNYRAACWLAYNDIIRPLGSVLIYPQEETNYWTQIDNIANEDDNSIYPTPQIIDSAIQNYLNNTWSQDKGFVRIVKPIANSQ